MILLDTNALVHYFLDDIPDQTSKVENLLNSQKLIFIPELVFAEAEYVFRKQYKLSKEEYLKIVRWLLALPNIEVTVQLRRAVELYSNAVLSFNDCLIVEQGRGMKVASFDAQMLNYCDEPYWK